MNRGDIRKVADKLLDILASELLKDLNGDRSAEIRQVMNDINSSGINWNTDVVNSVKAKLNILTVAANKRLKEKYKMEGIMNENLQTIWKNFWEYGILPHSSSQKYLDNLANQTLIYMEQLAKTSPEMFVVSDSSIAIIRNENNDKIELSIKPAKLQVGSATIHLPKNKAENWYHKFKSMIKFKLSEMEMEKNKKSQKDRMQHLLKTFEQKNEIIKEDSVRTTDESKVIEEAGRLKELARIDEWLSNSQFGAASQFSPGFGQTVNSFLPNFSQNNMKHNPNYTYLQPAEALCLAIKRTLESGAPVKDMGFYEEVNWNLNNMGFDSKLPLDIKNAVSKLLKDNI